MQPGPIVIPSETFARGKAIFDVIEAQRTQLEGVEASHRTQFEDMVRRHGIRSEWRSLPYFGSDVGVHAHYADLAAVARPDPAGRTASPPGLVESLVLTSGRPIIMLPPGGTVSLVRPSREGWHASHEAIRAVAEALPCILHAAVTAVFVRVH